MRALDKNSVIGVIGAGTMGAGIAQVAAMNGHKVIFWDANEAALKKGRDGIDKGLAKLVEKGKLKAEESALMLSRVFTAASLSEFKDCDLTIEAIIEDLKIKTDLFKSIDKVVNSDCVISSNTSSLSIAALSAAVSKPERVIGIHFFNPAVLMPLVEIIPGIRTDSTVLTHTRSLIDSWGKATVVAKDTPGFIVNRIARPFYGESIRILEEGLADAATIDWALKELGGFKMGPFELMDLIGNDVNFAVTSSVFEAFFYDPRYRPSLTQKRLVEAGMLGRKVGIGYYNYKEGVTPPMPLKNPLLGQRILTRVLSMLINEAVDALYLGVASSNEIDTAMTKGVNYPKGLLRWGEELGFANVLSQIERLREEYAEDRYRASPLLKKFVREGSPSFN